MMDSYPSHRKIAFKKKAPPSGLMLNAISPTLRSPAKLIYLFQHN